MSGPDDLNLSQNQHFQNMKHKPHKFTFRRIVRSAAIPAILALLHPVHAPVLAQEEAAVGNSDAAAAASPAQVSTITDLVATEQLAESRAQLESLESLQCNIYETVHLSALRFYAHGTYAQASGNRVRLEFKIYPIRGMRKEDKAALALDGEPEDVGKQKPTGSLVQVSNGNNLWSLWTNGDSRHLTRRNIRTVLAAADAAESFDSKKMLEDLGAGGLQALLARLETGMEFGKVREQSSGDTRILILAGRWTSEALEQYFNLKDTAAPLPNWIPDYVRVYLDADRQLPRRIQYLKKHPNPQIQQVLPLVTLDFRGMTVNGDVSDDLFDFKPPEGLPELDLTDKTVEAIQKAAGVSPAPTESSATEESPTDKAAPPKEAASDEASDETSEEPEEATE